MSGLLGIVHSHGKDGWLGRVYTDGFIMVVASVAFRRLSLNSHLLNLGKTPGSYAHDLAFQGVRHGRLRIYGVFYRFDRRSTNITTELQYISIVCTVVQYATERVEESSS